MNLVIITGLSGAGKSQAVKSLEDMGYFCVDNIPISLVSRFTELLSRSDDKFDKAALVCDIRGGTAFDGFFEQLDAFEARGNSYEILFMDANNYNLVRRYKETRHKHPLMDDTQTLTDAICKERKLLDPIKERSNYIVNTSYKTPAQTIKEIKEIFSAEESGSGMKITILSFGFKHGMPNDCDLMFDVRFLPNPYYIPELTKLSGLESEVSDYVMSFDNSKLFFKMLTDMIDYLLPLYIEEGRAQLVIAIGCTGGKHRSITFAEKLGAHIKDVGHLANIVHRDLGK